MARLEVTGDNPTIELAADDIRNGGGAVNASGVDGVLVVEGTVSKTAGSWFPIAVVSYSDYNSYATITADGGYYFDLVGLDAVRVRLDSGTGATVELNVKEG